MIDVGMDTRIGARKQREEGFSPSVFRLCGRVCVWRWGNSRYIVTVGELLLSSAFMFVSLKICSPLFFCSVRGRMDGIGKKLGVKRHVCVFWEEDEQAARAPLLDKKRGERKREKKKK